MALPHWALTICLQFTASTDCKRKVFYLIPTQIYLERTRREPEALLKNPGQLRWGLPPRTASVCWGSPVSKEKMASAGWRSVWAGWWEVRVAKSDWEKSDEKSWESSWQLGTSIPNGWSGALCLLFIGRSRHSKVLDRSILLLELISSWL